MTTTVRGRRRRPLRTEEPEVDDEPVRRPYARRRWIALAAVLTVLGLGYIVIFTSTFGANSVTVAGARTISADTVRAAAAIEPGTPLVRLDTDEVAARVAKLPKVFSVDVSRSFPSTVEITVVERTPVAKVSSATSTQLVDGTGLGYETVKESPPGLPELMVSTVRPDDPTTRAAVAVLAALPQQLRGLVAAVAAKTPGSVQLTLADERVVKWGSPDNSARKAAVLAPLLTRPGKVYDVATPDFPTVSS
jgi:cell division protein FtsQ